MVDFPGSHFPAARWMAFQLRITIQVGSLRITLNYTESKLVSSEQSIYTIIY